MRGFFHSMYISTEEYGESAAPDSPWKDVLVTAFLPETHLLRPQTRHRVCNGGFDGLKTHGGKRNGNCQ